MIKIEITKYIYLDRQYNTLFTQGNTYELKREIVYTSESTWYLKSSTIVADDGNSYMIDETRVKSLFISVEDWRQKQIDNILQ